MFRGSVLPTIIFRLIGRIGKSETSEGRVVRAWITPPLLHQSSASDLQIQIASDFCLPIVPSAFYSKMAMNLCRDGIVEFTIQFTSLERMMFDPQHPDFDNEQARDNFYNRLAAAISARFHTPTGGNF